MLLYWQCQAEPIFISSDGKAARAAGLFPGIWQIGGVLRYVHHTPIGTIPTQPTAKNTESFPIHCNIPQRRTATCPERGSARGKSGLRNSERLSPSQTCPRQSVPPKGKEPHCPKCPPRKGKSLTAQSVPPERERASLPKCPPWKETIRQKTQALRPGASVRRPTLYNIWYNFFIIFINNTITCIL